MRMISKAIVNYLTSIQGELNSVFKQEAFIFEKGMAVFHV